MKYWYAFWCRLVENDSWRRNFLIVMSVWFFLNLGMENLNSWMLIHEKTFHSDFLSGLLEIHSWTFVVFVPLAILALAVYKPSWHLSERWLIFFGASIIETLSYFFGFQSPYPFPELSYLETPCLDFIERWQVIFVPWIFLFGPLLALTHFLVRTHYFMKNTPPQLSPLWWRIASFLLAWGVTVAAFIEPPKLCFWCS